MYLSLDIICLHVSEVENESFLPFLQVLIIRPESIKFSINSFRVSRLMKLIKCNICAQFNKYFFNREQWTISKSTSASSFPAAASLAFSGLTFRGRALPEEAINWEARGGPSSPLQIRAPHAVASHSASLYPLGLLISFINKQSSKQKLMKSNLRISCFTHWFWS